MSVRQASPIEAAGAEPPTPGMVHSLYAVNAVASATWGDMQF